MSILQGSVLFCCSWYGLRPKYAYGRENKPQACFHSFIIIPSQFRHKPLI